MAQRTAEAEWQGSLQQSAGTIRLGSGAFEGHSSFGSRVRDERGTNPEALIAAAHADCFSMALALALGQTGLTPHRTLAKAAAHIERVEGFRITRIELGTEAEVPGIAAAKFHEQAETSQRGRPVSRAPPGTGITLAARLLAG